MTLRLCIFGNSHIAAMREAWRTNPGRWPDIEARFVGAHGDLLLQTEIRDGHLYPMTTESRDALKRLNGIESVDLASSDALVIAGCQVALNHAVQLKRSMRWIGLPTLARTPELAMMMPALVSYSAARASLCAILSDLLGPTLARHFRAGTGKPCWIVSQPRYSVAVTQTKKPHLKPYVAAVRSGDGASLSSLFHDAADLAARAAGATFIPQHPGTIRRDMLTATQYMRGAMRLSAREDLPQPPDDISHANALYGALVIEQIIAAVIGQTGPDLPDLDLSDVEQGGE
ncbi:MAG: hypothetical protein NTX73_05625 [Rhodobacterales bacterium]|nr:hypothetical protein [Rhodobacterales bacterium]